MSKGGHASGEPLAGEGRAAHGHPARVRRRQVHARSRIRSNSNAEIEEVHHAVQ